MKKFLQILSLILLMSVTALNAQNVASSKVTADLMSKIEESQNPNDLIRVIIMMNDQYDATKTVNQMRYLDKSQKREFVIDELKRISNEGQISIINRLQQGQKSMSVQDIHQYWIVNAVSCSMTKDMIYTIAARTDVKFVMSDFEIRIPDGEDEEVQTCFFNPYNTDVRFKDGQITDIWQYNYPEGPEE